MTPFEAVDAKLTGPGSPFEMVEEDVLGQRMLVFKQRPRSLREYLERSRAFGDAEFIVHGERRITFAEHTELVAAAAHTLRERYGVRPGDRVAILAENRPEWILSFWATVSLGGIVAALNGWWAGDEIRYGIRDSDPRLLIGDRKRLARVAGLDLGVPVVEMESDFPALLEAGRGAPLPDVPIDEDDPAVILYTSGTTGRPKGALNSHRGVVGFVTLNMLNALRGAMVAAGSPAKDPAPRPCSLVTSPLFHQSGLYAGVVMMLAGGVKTVWRSGRFDPEEVLRLIERERVTSWSPLGNMAHRVVSHPRLQDYDRSSVRNVGSGGAPTSADIQEKLRRAFPSVGSNVALGYGLSESVGVISGIGGEELRQYPDSVGRITLTTEVEIRDPEGNALPEGVEGEIFARSPYLMLEYWRKPEETARSLRPGRWLATGDIGRMQDGRLYINSRARDMILRGAENIYPVEIEHRLEQHPGVAEAAVVGVEHEELGQEVKAIVVPAAGVSLDPAELAGWVAEKLAPFKVPAHWEVRAQPLPRNATGKVLKNVLLGQASNTFLEE